MASVAVYIECPITGRILGVARKDDANAWGLPGGKVEEGEAEVDAAVRELQEETGIIARPSKFIEIFRRDGGITFMLNPLNIAYVGNRGQGEAAVDWVTREQLLAGPFG